VLLLQIRPIIAATALAQLILVEVRSVAARADDYPEHGRPITMIVGYAPGGVTDTGARLMAAALEPRLHTQL
jgi:tripartite-type tricarboxylate transporter receptor subunit TctC